MSESFDDRQSTDFVDGADDDVDDDDLEDDGPEDDVGNRVVGALPRNVLDYVARQIVDDPDGVVIEAVEGGRNRVDLRLHVAPEDMGKIIGRRGRVAQSIRAVVRAAGAREGVEASVDIVD